MFCLIWKESLMFLSAWFNKPSNSDKPFSELQIYRKNQVAGNLRLVH